jgi:hypothetical protein
MALVILILVLLVAADLRSVAELREIYDEQPQVGTACPFGAA